MPRERIGIETADGICPTWVATPAGTGPWPGVILFSDAAAIRPASIAMAERLADAGYVVLLPDIYYRYGPYDPVVPAEALKDIRATLGPMIATTSFRKAAGDAAALIAWLDGDARVAPKSYGVTGYCMGGAIAVTAAGLFPDRIAACAAFHAGNLASDDAESPHLLAPAIAAELYVGVADADPSYPPAMADRFTAALDAAGVRYRHELYPGAAHGWTQTDFPVFDAAAAERHWQELVALLRRTIG